MRRARDRGDVVPTIFLHIGMNKTGSSAVQSYLSKHRTKLAAAGTLYPRAAGESGVHYPLSRALGFGQKGRPAADPVRLKAELHAEIRAARPTRVILSSEDFVLDGPIAAVRELLEPHPVRIVVYLRRHDHWWLSAYNQAVRMVANPPWESGLAGYLKYCHGRRRPIGRYRELVDAWAAIFGPGNILLRPFEVEQNPGGIVPDFLRTVGLESLAGTAAPADVRANVSLGNEALHIVDLLQRAQIEPALRARLLERVLSEREHSQAADLMRPRMRLRLIEENRADYEYLARTYLGREDGVLFHEPDPRPDPDWRAPDPPSRVQVVERLLALVAATR